MCSRMLKWLVDGRMCRRISSPPLTGWASRRRRGHVWLCARFQALCIGRVGLQRRRLARGDQPSFFGVYKNNGLIYDDFIGSITPYDENDDNRIGYRPVNILLYNSVPLVHPSCIDIKIELVDRIMRTPVGQSFEEGDLTIEIIAKDKAERIFEQQS